MMNRVFIGLMLLISVFSAQAGVAIGGTRFVFEEKHPQLDITLENSDSQPWLIKTQILPPALIPGAEQTSVSSPFIATPPLFVLAGEHANKIRVISDGGQLPNDRESLFDLVITAIPSSQQKEARDSVQVAIRSHMKLLYRPASLQGNPDKAHLKLVWQRTSHEIAVNNPTPFYVTLLGVTVNGKAVSNTGVVAPFSSRKLPWCRETTQCDIRFQSINDYGKLLPVVSIAL